MLPVLGWEARMETRRRKVAGSIPRYKVALVTWVAIYPALTITLAVLGPPLAPLPLYVRTLVVTALLVPLMVYVLVPAVQRVFAAWLRPPTRER
jgi:antibiotic biosynthesis monooxygenase (ABM) superfamily enzyme